jgi:hypothetical protein
VRVKILYVVNNTTKSARFIADEVTAQIGIEGSILNFVNGRDWSGPIDVFQGAHIEVIEHRPSSQNDEAWLQHGIIEPGK